MAAGGGFLRAVLGFLRTADRTAESSVANTAVGRMENQAVHQLPSQTVHQLPSQTAHQMPSQTVHEWQTPAVHEWQNPAAHGAQPPAEPQLRPETENSLSNLEDAAFRNPETLRDVRPGDAFSGVYHPASGRFMSFRSVDDPAAMNAPVNAVNRYGGHGEIEDTMVGLIGGRDDKKVAFTMFAEDDGFSVGWRSRSVNQYYHDTIAAPEEYRGAVMDAISQATGRRVWSR